jgi:hypothetical protein
MTMVSKARFGDKVASRSVLSDAGKTAPLPDPKIELTSPVRLGRSSSDIPLNTRQQQRRLNPRRFQGNWAGIITGIGTPSYSYEMNLRRIGASRFTGTSVISDLNNPSIFGVMPLRGRVVNGALLFKETRITDQNPPLGLRWCIKGGRLRISGFNGRPFLRGFWSDPGCNSGQIELQKQ